MTRKTSVTETREATINPLRYALTGWDEVHLRAVDTARILAADAVQEVGNGHPGTAMSRRGNDHRPVGPGTRLRGWHVLASDGDLMEGVTAEVSSIAGHQRLGNLG